MFNRKAFTNSLPIVAQMMGRKFGVKVVIGGYPQTNGQVIVLPALPEDDERALRIARGFLDHECGHVSETDFEVFRPKGIEGHLANIFEDIRIETAQIRKFPGSRINLENVTEEAIEMGIFRLMDRSENHHPLTVLINTFLYSLRWEVLGQRPIKPLAEAADEIFKNTFPEALVRDIEAIMAKVPDLASTLEASNLSREVMALLEQEAEEEQPNQGGDSEAGAPDQQDSDQSQDSGESGSGPDGSGNDEDAGTPQADSDASEDRSGGGEASAGQDDADQGEGSASDSSSSSDPNQGEDDEGNSAQGEGTESDANGDSGTSDGGDSEPGTNEADQASQDQSDPGDGSTASVNEPTDSGADPSSDAGDQANGEGADPQTQAAGPAGKAGDQSSGDAEQQAAVKELLDGGTHPSIKSDLGDVIAEMLLKVGAEARSSGKPLVEVATETEADLTGNHLSSHTVASETNALRTRLTAKLQSVLKVRNRTKRTGRRLDQRKLYRLGLKDTRVFQARGQKKAPNTAIQILLDQSGSMRIDGRAILATKAVMATALAAKGIPKVDVGAAGFSFNDRGAPVVRPMKRFGAPISETRFEPVAHGGTSTAEAMWWSGYQLATRKEERKILLVATDGIPEDHNATVHACSALTDMGIEVLGLGILSDIHPEHAQRVVRIDDLKMLPSTLLGLLEEALIGGIAA